MGEGWVRATGAWGMKFESVAVTMARGSIGKQKREGQSVAILLRPISPMGR